METWIGIITYINELTAELNWTNALLFKIRNYVNQKTLRHIYFSTSDSYLNYVKVIWAQNSNGIQQIIICPTKKLSG